MLGPVKGDNYLPWSSTTHPRGVHSGCVQTRPLQPYRCIQENEQEKSSQPFVGVLSCPIDVALACPYQLRLPSQLSSSPFVLKGNYFSHLLLSSMENCTRHAENSFKKKVELRDLVRCMGGTLRSVGTEIVWASDLACLDKLSSLGVEFNSSLVSPLISSHFTNQKRMPFASGVLQEGKYIKLELDEKRILKKTYSWSDHI